MNIKEILSGRVVVFWLLLTAVIVVGCTPSGGPVSVTRGVSTETAAVTGWCEGGPKVVTAEDVGCYLENADQEQVYRIDEETAVLYADPQSTDDWVGAAVIYHSPSNSMLVLDQFGDVIPLKSVFNSRAGLAVFDALAGDVVLMASVKYEVQQRWQTTASNEPEIRLAASWQDGQTTIFLVAIAGLKSDDARYYCPSQRWTIGDIMVDIESLCGPHVPGMPISQFFFVTQSIEGDSEQPVKVALDGLESNLVQVSEGTVSDETAVYLAVLEQITNRPLIIRGETAPGLDETFAESAIAVDPNLLEIYQTANERPISLRFLFQDSSAHFVQLGIVVDRDYLIFSNLQQSCQNFRSEYPGLVGVVTLSGIGFSEDGSQALLHLLLDCGTADRTAAYYTLAKTDDGWQVTNTFSAPIDLPTLTSEKAFDSQSNGCGDIFLYISDSERSEYLTIWVNAREIDLSSGLETFDLAAYPEDIEVKIDVYAGSVEKLGEFPYCNDIAPMAEPESVWRAVSGFITVSSTAQGPVEPCQDTYQAGVLLEDVVFMLDEETIHLPSLRFDDVTVGWCAG